MKLNKVVSFIVRKKYIFIAIFCCAIIGLVAIIPSIKTSVKPKYEYTIVIDAGHGGRDGGSVGDISVEKDLNLKYAKALQKLLGKANINVIMTRTDDDGLYDENADNKKLSDMRARRDIIRNAQPDLVVSVHMNSYPLANCVGAKTFYKMDSEASFNAAKAVQNSLHYYIDNASSTISKGDYYILNCTDYTSILIECGFISTPSEEQLLNDDAYCEKFMYSVYCGIMLYLGF